MVFDVRMFDVDGRYGRKCFSDCQQSKANYSLQPSLSTVQPYVLSFLGSCTSASNVKK